MMKLRRYFEVLEIPVNASYEEARAAYRDMIRVWHPDKFAQNSRLEAKATEKLKQIITAWKHLEKHYKSVSVLNVARQNEKGASSDGAAAPEDKGDTGRPGTNAVSPLSRCSRCQVLNSVPDGMPLHQARCGQCGNHLSRQPGEKNRSGSTVQYLENPANTQGENSQTLTFVHLVTGLSIGLIIMLLLFLLKNSF